MTIIKGLLRGDEVTFKGRHYRVTGHRIAPLDLGPEIEGLTGRQLRMRVLTIEPGGHIGLHSHKDRPAEEKARRIWRVKARHEAPFWSSEEFRRALSGPKAPTMLY